MRMITLMGAAAVALTAAITFAAPAGADRICRQVCDEGFCKSRCFDRGERLYLYDRDRDDLYWRHHDRRGLGVHGPGFDVDIGR